MRRLLLLALVVVPLVSACGSSGGRATHPDHDPKRATTPEALASEVRKAVPHWIKVEHLPSNAVAGAHLFAVAGCTACHNYDGVGGGGQLGAPDLTAIGRRHRGIAFQIRHLRCPSCVHHGSPMPAFGSLGPTRLRELAIFLEASKGTH